MSENLDWRYCRVERKTAEVVKDAIIASLQPWREQAHTLTSENGKELAQQQQIAEHLDAMFFFAHPYAAWERGSNESMNDLLRR